jgi:adenosylmethionine-8-amino-7-oxononanoate aminotransferase
MNDNYNELKKLDHTYLWHPFTQMQEWMEEEPCIIERGEGSILVDLQGRKFIDGVSSLWCNLHGHRRQELDDALKHQLDRIAHSTFLGLSHAPGIRLAQRLIEVAPPGLQRVFYSDNGATAVEVALRMAFQYWQLKGETKRTRFVSLAEAYHGDTMGAVSLGYSETLHRFYRPLLFPTLRINPPHVFRYFRRMDEQEALKAAIQEAEEKISKERDSLAALIVEPLMQGAAGMWSQPAGYLRALREICRDHKILLIVDEVATGFGRTGRLFACEHEGVTPDLLCLAKGLSGGYLPLAATLATEEVFSAFLGEYGEFKSFFHGHTYTGNSLGCALGLASLDIFQTDKTLEMMQSKILYLQRRLEDDFRPLAHVGDVRQWGFMIGIELVEDKSTLTAYSSEERMGHKVVLEARRRGVIVRPLGDVIVLMPPLAISEDEIKLLTDVIYQSIKTVTEG